MRLYAAAPIKAQARLAAYYSSGCIHRDRPVLPPSELFWKAALVVGIGFYGLAISIAMKASAF